MPAFTIGTYDVGADNKLNLLAAINAEHGTNYTIDEYQFTEPARVTIPTPTYNTKIKLGPLAATGYIGFKTIYYNRIHASEIGPLKITWQNEQFLSEMLPRLSQKYGIALTVDDVYEQRIIPPTPPETEVSITLNFKETSVAYYGGTQIVLGSNDPSLEFETPETLPFKNDLVFFVNNFTKTKKGYNYLESSVLGIASDRLRSRTLTVTNTDTVDYSNIIKNTYTDDQRKQLEQYLPFVFTWSIGDSRTVRGINIYGDVIEINETSNLVEKKSSILNINPLVESELVTARTKILVREGTQAKDGSIYFLVGDPTNEQVNLYKSTDFGDNFTQVSVNKTNRATFNYANWEDVVIHDLMVVGTKLSVLVSNPNSYGTNPNKRSFGPAVEEFNLTNNTSDYFPINPEFVTNTGFSITLNKESKMRFISPETEDSILSVVSIARTTKTLEHVIAYHHRKDGFEFTAEVLGTRYLDYPIYGISAFSKPLKKDTTGKFVAIEILTVTNTSKRDDYFLIETGIRGESTDMGYGVVTISGIVKEDKIGGWKENTLDLNGGSLPIFVTITDKGQRNHYIFSGNNGIYEIEYSEVSPNEYVPSLKNIFNIRGNPGFNLECDIGNGLYVSPSIVENPLFTPIYNDPPDGESLKPAITFSFIGEHKVTNNSIWLTSSAIGVALTERSFSDEYKHLGFNPLAVYSDSQQNIYAITQYQGIYKSSDNGNSWVDHLAYKNYFKNDKYLGTALINFIPKDFKKLSCMNGITFIEVNPARTLEVFKIDTHTPNYQLHLNDKVIYKFDDTKPNGDGAINSAYITTSLNNTSEFSPRTTLAWDTDKNNNIRALAKYQENGTETYLNQIDIPSSIQSDVITAYSDVDFLGLKVIAITYNDTDGNNFYMVKANDDLVRVGLRFSDQPQFPNFEPTDIIPLWDGNDSAISYTPIIITGKDKNVLILERDGIAGGNMTINIQTLTVPDDNNKPLQWFPMFNSNRFDRCVFQENNGIFKLVYTWDGANTKSVITLEKIFATPVAMNISKIFSGCEFNKPDVEPYGESTIGPWPVYGTFISNECQGFTLKHKLADGYGGYFWKVISVNSPDCGYVEPVPGDTGLGGANFNIG